jgi:hypothetical protein
VYEICCGMNIYLHYVSFSLLWGAKKKNISLLLLVTNSTKYIFNYVLQHKTKSPKFGAWFPIV